MRALLDGGEQVGANREARLEALPGRLGEQCGGVAAVRVVRVNQQQALAPLPGARRIPLPNGACARGRVGYHLEHGSRVRCVHEHGEAPGLVDEQGPKGRVGVVDGVEAGDGGRAGPHARRLQPLGPCVQGALPRKAGPHGLQLGDALLHVAGRAVERVIQVACRERAVARQADRVATLENPGKEDLMAITVSDLKEDDEPEETPGQAIAQDAAPLPTEDGVADKKRELNL